MRKIDKVLLVVNLHKRDAQRLSTDIRHYLEERGIEVVFFGFKGKATPPTIEKVDLAISLGGDGTVLFCARMLQDLGIPILAVNLGTFGFITEVSVDEWQEAFEKFCCGETILSHRLMFRVTISRDGERLFLGHGLNDVVVSANGISKVVNLKLHLNETLLGTFRADGIIVATPTGSTAYSMAAGGPIVYSEMEALIVTPICPFTLSNRPLVVSGEDVIEIVVLSNQRTELNLTVDGQEMIPLKEGDVITVEKSRSRAMLALSNKRNFYEVVRTKLNWSGGSNA